MLKNSITLLNKPPSEIEGYQINTDFRVWLKVDALLYKLSNGDSEVIMDIMKLVFVNTRKPTLAKMQGVMDFYKGYPSYLQEIKSSKKKEVTMSFEYDINWIILAIRNQSGIDLSYRRTEPFHWWEFLLEIQSLEDTHYISQLMQARGYRGTDKELKKLKNKLKIPERESDNELLQKVQENIRELENGK